MPRSLQLRHALLAGAALGFTATVAAAAAPAKGVRVEPGMWEFVSSLPDPVSGEAIRQTHRTCVRDRLITPERVMARLSECRIWNASFDGPAARWRMSCETPAGPITGSGNLRTNGTAVAGSLELSYAIGGLEIPMTSPFQGKRIGGCR